MKKILAIVMSVAMILSVGAMAISAAVYTAKGWYGNPAGFTPVEDTLTLTWVADASEKINLTDCSLDDWADLNLPVTTIDINNVVAWINDGYVPAEFVMNAQFAADKDFLYVAFNIVDNDVRASAEVADPLDPTNLHNYNTGDCFQMNIDFGNKIKWTLENDPDKAEEMTNVKAVFYSFGFRGDGEDVYISVEESDDNRILGAGDKVNVNPARLDLYPGGQLKQQKDDAGKIVEEYILMPDETRYEVLRDTSGSVRAVLTPDGEEITSDDMTDTGTKGKTWLTEDGWSAEFCIPFSELFYDYCYKSYNDSWNGMIGNSITIDEDHPLEIGIGLYNLNWNNPNPEIAGDMGGLAAAFGLHSGEVDENGDPVVTWGPDDLCTKLSLAYTEGMEFTSPYLLPEGKEALETVVEDDQQPVESVTEPVTETETETAAQTEAETTAQTTAQTTAPAAEEGCASVVGFSAVAVLVAAAAAVVLKKKD